MAPNSSADEPASTSRISAEATTTPSARWLTSTAWAGEEIPKPTSTGRLVWFRMAATVRCTVSDTASRSPVTPMLLTA